MQMEQEQHLKKHKKKKIYDLKNYKTNIPRVSGKMLSPSCGPFPLKWLMSNSSGISTDTSNLIGTQSSRSVNFFKCIMR